MPMGISSYVELAELFPDRECSLEYLAECLGALPLNLVLVKCASANQVVSGPGTLNRVDRQRKVAMRLLSADAGERLNEIVRTRHEGDLEKTTLFFRAQLLELVRWALLLCGPETPALEGDWTQEEKDLFVQAALMCSWISEARVRAVLQNNKSIEALKDIALVFFRGALDAGLVAADAWRVVGRGQRLFLEYLPKHYPEVEHDFKRATGLSLHEYMTAAGALVAMHLQLDNTMVLEDAVTLGRDTGYAEEYRAYQELQVWTIDGLRERLWPGGRIPQCLDDIPAFDLKPLREKPIIAMDDGQGIIPDPVLLADSVMIGPLFQLAGRWDDNEVFGRFGDAFEEYSVDILARMFPSGEGLHQRLHRKVSTVDIDGKTSEIDACLDYVARVILLEAKSVFIPDDSVNMCNEAQFRTELEKRYVRGERDVGIGQLARTIRSLATGAWQGPDAECTFEMAYPVLLVHDRLLVGPLEAQYLANLLVLELDADSVPSSWQWQVGNFRFAPLTILTVEDLENLACSDGIDFLRILETYASEVPDRKESLHDFLTSSDDFRNSLRIDLALAEAAESLLGDCARQIFGREPNADIVPE